jgi:hypothetical protein
MSAGNDKENEITVANSLINRSQELRRRSQELIQYSVRVCQKAEELIGKNFSTESR